MDEQKNRHQKNGSEINSSVLLQRILSRSPDAIAELNAFAKSKSFFNDILFFAFVKDILAIEELLRSVIDKNLNIVSVYPQMSFRTFGGRSVVCDALCKDSSGKYILLEVQTTNSVDHFARMGLIAGNAIAQLTEHGDPRFKNVAKVMVVTFLNFDPFGYGRAVYFIEHRLKDFGDLVPMPFEYAVANYKAEDGSEAAEAMSILRTVETGNTKFPQISAQIQKILTNKENFMSSSFQEIEEYYNQKFAEAKAEAEKKAKAEGEAIGEARGRAEGRAEGKAEGRAEGRAEGEAYIINSLMKTMAFDEIMDNMAILPENRGVYRAMIRH